MYRCAREKVPPISDMLLLDSATQIAYKIRTKKVIIRGIMLMDSNILHFHCAFMFNIYCFHTIVFKYQVLQVL